jgi:hypothetical protein
MVARNSKTVKAVALILENPPGDEAIDMAVEIVEAVENIQDDRKQWAVVARLDPGTPIMGMGTYTTEKQAAKAASKLVGSTQDRTGCGHIVIPLKPRDWIDGI